MPKLAPSPVAWVHDAVVAGLVATAPLSWDEEPTQLWVLVRHAVLLVGLSGLLLEVLGGWRDAWRWSARGLLLGALVLLLGIAAVRSPLPIQGWGLGVEIVGDAAWAWYLLQVIPSREGIAGAALAGGLAAELLVALLQWRWVLPGMAQASDASLGVERSLLGKVRERIHHGGVYGTFTQANALAAYLLVAAPPVLAAVARRRGAWRGLAVTLGLAVAVVAVLAKSKGAYLAAGVSVAGVWWCWRWPGRWLVPVAVAGTLAVALAVLPLRGSLSASSQVRLGYWEAAAALVRAHPGWGVGLAGYRADAEAVLPRWAEFATHVHNEPLEAAAEAGLAAGALLLALLALLPGRRHGLPVPEDGRGGWLPAVAAGVLTWYCCAFDMLSDNVRWWPGADVLVGGLPAVQMLWWLALAALISATIRLLGRGGSIPAWACAGALGALGLHCLIDFDLHASGVAETVVVVAILGGGATRACGAPAAGGRMRAVAAVPAVALTLVLAAGLWWWMGVAGRERQAQELSDGATAVLRAPASTRPEALRALGLLLGPDADGLAPPALVGAALEQAYALAEADYPLRLRLLALLPASAARAQRSAALAAAWPTGAVAQWLVAQDEEAQARALGDAPGAAAHWHAALDAGTRAIAAAPWELRIRRSMVALERAAAAALPAEQHALQARADAEQAEIARLEPEVNWTDRE